jgi:hypothetical protein
MTGRRKERDKTGRRKERKKGENRLSLNIDVLGLPMQFRKTVYRWKCSDFGRENFFRLRRR